MRVILAWGSAWGKADFSTQQTNTTMSEITVRLDEWVAQDMSRLSRWKGYHRGTFDMMTNELVKEAVCQELAWEKKVKATSVCQQKGRVLYGEHEAEVLAVLKETEAKLREILGVRGHESVVFKFVLGYRPVVAVVEEEPCGFSSVNLQYINNADRYDICDK